MRGSNSGSLKLFIGAKKRSSLNHSVESPGNEIIDSRAIIRQPRRAAINRAIINP
jgi:hypothetical protein